MLAAVRRVATTLALALFLFGCGLITEPVELLTGTHGCWAGAGPVAEGLLVSDPVNGTAIKYEVSRGQPPAESPMPVMWPTDYTGRRLLGGEIEVLDGAGMVVATTGRRYRLIAGPVSLEGEGPFLKDNRAFPACEPPSKLDRP